MAAIFFALSLFALASADICAEPMMNGATGLFCDCSANGQVWREYLFRRNDTSVVVRVHASELGAASLPGLEQIFRSLEFHEIQQ